MKAVKVGAYTYTVQWVKYIKKAWGDMTAKHQKIRCVSDATPERRVSTLLHEVEHAINDQWLSELEDDLEERITAAHGHAWAAVFRENPELLYWILDELHPGWRESDIRWGV